MNRSPQRRSCPEGLEGQGDGHDDQRCTGSAFDDPGPPPAHRPAEPCDQACADEAPQQGGDHERGEEDQQRTQGSTFPQRSTDRTTCTAPVDHVPYTAQRHQGPGHQRATQRAGTAGPRVLRWHLGGRLDERGTGPDCGIDALCPEEEQHQATGQGDRDVSLGLGQQSGRPSQAEHGPCGIADQRADLDREGRAEPAADPSPQ